MANIQELFDFALKSVPDAQHIHVKQGHEEIMVTRQPVHAHAASAYIIGSSDGPASIVTQEVEPQPSGEVVKAPLVGVFYTAPSPDAAPFVSIGQRVKKGDVLCIIEAMKLMNEIESAHDGIVEQFLVENGAMVEFGQTLLTIKAE
ncbi:MAG: acetyl-CoA carboxylase biotin carboxyl carrier protein [Oscillospiraceae bacterium]|jgi:acetyl-CoA carboxylase biotin carboxyl carrier protein|nr:acetyl-CoA carboxylase biotin carboxyl carrier protein [Oscillospiraceae bacterium]